jgi:hypothetical protein
MIVTLCEGHDCGGRSRGTEPRRTADPGSRLCRPCGQQVKANLIDLPAVYDNCESALLPRRNPALQRVSGSRQATGILLDEEAITTRSGILGLLASWSALVADERAVTRPARRHPADLAAFLVRHLNWLLAHPAAADFAEEICRITRRACRSDYTHPVLNIDLGPCVHSGCGADMAATPPTRDGKSAREVRCTAGHAWQPHQWLQLFRQIQQDKNGRDPTLPRQP